jgi:hypothetical protein
MARRADEAAAALQVIHRSGGGCRNSRRIGLREKAAVCDPACIPPRPRSAGVCGDRVTRMSRHRSAPAVTTEIARIGGKRRISIPTVALRRVTATLHPTLLYGGCLKPSSGPPPGESSSPQRRDTSDLPHRRRHTGRPASGPGCGMNLGGPVRAATPAQGGLRIRSRPDERWQGLLRGCGSPTHGF